MSEKLLKEYKLNIGQKILYPHSGGSHYGSPIYMEIVTVRDVSTNYNNEAVLLVKEHDGYLNLSDIWTKDNINNLFKTDV